MPVTRLGLLPANVVYGKVMFSVVSVSESVCHSICLQMGFPCGLFKLVYMGIPYSKLFIWDNLPREKLMASGKSAFDLKTFLCGKFLHSSNNVTTNHPHLLQKTNIKLLSQTAY